MTDQSKNLELVPWDTIPFELVTKDNLKEIFSVTLVSWSFYHVSTRIYLKQLGSQPISLSEIERYLKTSPKIFRTNVPLRGPEDLFHSVVPQRRSGRGQIFGVYGIPSSNRWESFVYSINPDNPIEQKLSIQTSNAHPIIMMLQFYSDKEMELFRQYGILYRPNINHTSRITVLPGQENIDDRTIFRLKRIFTRDSEDGERDNENNPEYLPPLENAKIYIPEAPILDLLSQYRILSGRLGCLSRNPNYAKEIILRQLDDKYKFFQDMNDIMSLVAGWTYFYVQMKVLFPEQELEIRLMYKDCYFTEDGRPIFLRQNDKDNHEDKVTKGILLMIDDIRNWYGQIREVIINLP